jgi:hypothetical protein
MIGIYSMSLSAAAAFYRVLARLPSIYRDHGASPAGAGFLLSLVGLVQIPVTLILPDIASRASTQVLRIAASVALMGAGLAGGSPRSHCFPIPVGGAHRNGSGRELRPEPQPFRPCAPCPSPTPRGYPRWLRASGMSSQRLAHYSSPSCMSTSWTIPLIRLLGLLVAQMWFGARAGRNRTISDRQPDRAT